MYISIFDVLGPVMIGPSSSHTAGAARLSRSAREIVKGDIAHISFGLYGSFAETYKGHGTDKALLAGALGLKEDDEGIVNVYELARQRGMEYDFYKAELNNVHENTVKMTIKKKDGSVTDIIGSVHRRRTDINIKYRRIEMELSLQCPDNSYYAV